MTYSQGIAPFYALFSGLANGGVDDGAFLHRLGCHGAITRVLDIGAGTGYLAFELARHGWHVTALEPDPEMFGAMLCRLSEQPALQPRVTLVPQGAGAGSLRTKQDVCVCAAVLHLLPEEEQSRVLRYAADSLRAGGALCLEAPVWSRARTDSDWEIVASRDIGALTVDHYSALIRDTRQVWLTRWRFELRLGGSVMSSVTQQFRWRAYPHAHYRDLLRSSGFEIVEELEDAKNSPFEDGESLRYLAIATTPRDKPGVLLLP
jgi:SAM-dependent methyltransferase